MLIYADQGRDVYENKGNIDKMTANNSDIYGNITWNLQKNSGYDGPLTLNDSFRAGFDGYSPRKSPPVARRTQPIFGQ